jgi:hypothetical protein
MTFFGMYQAYSNGSYGYGLYDSSVGFDTEASAGLAIVGGSYVVGLHSVNHDITKDGFYSNYLSDDYSSVSVDYIDPSTIGETGYRWIIGYASINYNFTLTASKYSSFGTYELQLSEFADGNTSFNIVGFNSEGLSDGVNLVDSESVPRIGKTDEEANKILGLSMKSETQEWTSYCTTNLLSTGTGVVDGDTYYRTDSRELAPSLMFYFYHAKNISTTGNLGTVIIMMQAVIPKNAVEDDIEFITITIDLVAKQYDDVDSYDASITYDKRYSMPSATLVNITNQSQLTTYFSLISFNDDYKKVYGKNYSNYHVLVTNNPLPLNTMITMMDFGASEDSVEYYYLTITEDIYNKSVLEYDAEGEVTYRLSDFIKMGSTSSDNTYDEVEANKKYFNDELDLVDEEFMFIFDFKDTNVTGTHLNNTILFELRNSSTDREVFSVLGIRQSVMTYNTYESSNIVLSQTISNNDSYLYYDITDEIDYQTNILYNQTENRQSVIDTNYESSAMGLNISFYNTQGTSVSSSMLMGTTINVDGVEYFADSDGVYRIKLAGKVSNLVRTVSITPGNGLPFEEYTVRFTLFASSDGLHNSNVDSSVYDEYDVVVVNSDNSISVDSADLEKIIDGETLLNLNNSNTNTYLIKYVSNLSNPNLRVELYKRNVDDINSTTYESVPITTLFSNYHSFSALSNEVKLDMDGSGKSTVKFLINDSGITSGSYRLVFRLYDNNQLIDDDVKNLIVKKNLIE